MSGVLVFRILGTLLVVLVVYFSPASVDVLFSSGCSRCCCCFVPSAFMFFGASDVARSYFDPPCGVSFENSASLFSLSMSSLWASLL